ncbi:MAG: EscC/YscC/HrcC family type III secretion system outer membrane ring protein [Chitinivibrionales bacterium]|nr:EscC/YscC/HrcC family type III secretion system outer membrane ring protein [Chitinivibrionales bacterium]MBD3357723.1 EscC/YscC/HrcC family type III secretion system outer membrane ring protein [Chitinivibrionales bacterium]
MKGVISMIKSLHYRVKHHFFDGRSVIRLPISLALIVLFFASMGDAATIRWKDIPYSHVSREEPLRELLEDFCAQHNLVPIISKEVAGTINGSFSERRPEEFFDHITSVYGLMYYFDGTSLYIYTANEAISEMITITHLTMARLRTALRETGIWDSRYPLKAASRGRIAYVSGPPRYVELVKETAKTLGEDAQQNARSWSHEHIVKVFPLKYAWAGDMAFDVANERVVMPGVATLLRSLVMEPAPPLRDMIRRPDDRNEPSKPRSARSTGSAQWNILGLRQSNNTMHRTTEEGPQPSIIADMRINAVIVKDHRDNIGYYHDLIGELDVPAGIIEINATIIDMNHSLSRELGVEWGMISSKDGSLSLEESYTQKFDDSFSPTSPGEPLTGFNLTTMLSNSAQRFLARIRALAAEGDAKIISRPTVTTFNNLQAVIAQSSILHVRVAGNEDVELFELSSNTVLRVTPHIVEKIDGYEIKMAVHIEDGGIAEDRTVDNIPQINRSVITTQTLVGENESLLIGGFIREATTKQSNHIPFLGKIPIIGNLFARKRNRGEKVERIFMITPRIIHGSADAGLIFKHSSVDNTLRDKDDNYPRNGRRPRRGRD